MSATLHRLLLLTVAASCAPTRTPHYPVPAAVTPAVAAKPSGDQRLAQCLLLAERAWAERERLPQRADLGDKQAGETSERQFVHGQQAFGLPTNSDLAITHEIRQRLMADESLSFAARNVKILTVNGRVTLRGGITLDRERSSVEAIAASVAGGHNVESEL